MLRRSRGFALAAILVFAPATCTGDDGTGGPTTSPSEPWRGGTLRVAVYANGPVWWDPAQYTGGIAWGLYRCCLLRTLMSYSGLPVQEGGVDLRPDIAAEPPTVSDDGLTWTFRLKEGIEFGPPFGGTELVASDVVRAVERLGHQDWLPPDNYALLFEVIDGFAEFAKGRAASIRGLETPDAHTLVVRLTEPAGDLPDRFALPATAPIPDGAPTDRAGHYIQYLVASGPYMIEGSEDLDFTRPAGEQRPVSGFVPMASVTLVRNPTWDPATDDLRRAYVDRIELVMFRTPSGFVHDIQEKRDLASDLADRMARGEIDLNAVYLGRAAAAAYEREPELRDRVFAVQMGRVVYLAFRLAIPPLDDIHVRKAIALALDRVELLRLYEEGGDRFGSVAWHLAPDLTERELLSDYRPAWMSDPEGDLDAAHAEMRLSSYDADGDGVCDDPVCRAIPSLDLEGQSILPMIEDELDAIGIGFRNESFPPVKFMEMLRTADEPGEHVGTVLVQWFAWGMDYPNGSTIFVPLADSSSLGTPNFTLLGANPSQLRRWGYPVSSVPSVDDRIDRCQSLAGADQPACWAELDAHLMEEVVPWVPLFFEERIEASSPRVARYSYDPARDFPALDQISLVPGSE